MLLCNESLPFKYGTPDPSWVDSAEISFRECFLTTRVEKDPEGMSERDPANNFPGEYVFNSPCGPVR